MRELPPSPLGELHDSTPGVGRQLSSEEKNWAIGAHLSTFIGAVAPIPMMNIVAPLAVWLMKKDSLPFAERHAREALNFNISIFIYGVVAAVSILLVIGLLLFPAVLLTWVIFSIVGAVKASNGEEYRYPLTMRFVKQP